MEFYQRVAYFLGCSDSQETPSSLLRAMFLFYDEGLLGALNCVICAGPDWSNVRGETCTAVYYCIRQHTSLALPRSVLLVLSQRYLLTHPQRYSYKKKYDYLRDVGS